MKRTATLLGSALMVLVAPATAAADPVNSPRNFPLAASCTGLGNVTLNQLGPAHTAAFLVEGTNTVVLVPFNGAPAIEQRGLEAGTFCDLGFGPVPVVIISR
jgi:hypothetical protein